MHTWSLPREMSCRCGPVTGRQRVGRRCSTRLHTLAAPNDNKVHARDAMTPNANQSAELAGLSAAAEEWTDFLSLSPLSFFCAHQLLFYPGSAEQRDADSHLKGHYWNLSRRRPVCLLLIYLFIFRSIWPIEWKRQTQTHSLSCQSQ